MKQADVKLGETYLTKIGPNYCKVIVRSMGQLNGGRTTYIVQRVGEDRPLPKHRTAAALHPIQSGLTDNPRGAKT